jgi:hypothetical protein
MGVSYEEYRSFKVKPMYTSKVADFLQISEKFRFAFSM